MTIVRFVAVAALGFFGGLIPAWAQGGPGTIRGQVTDPAGGSIPVAVVSANNGHGTSRSATTDMRGEYVLGNWTPSDHRRFSVMTVTESFGKTYRISFPDTARDEVTGRIASGRSPEFSASSESAASVSTCAWAAAENP